MCVQNINIKFPDWVDNFIKNSPEFFKTEEDRMLFSIELARLNVENETGGPFGAAIFEAKSGKLISVGINLVVSQTNSTAHAEMTAIMSAQAKLKTFDLGSEGLPEYQLVTSAQMCAMCFGAVPWSGVTSVICSANGSDVESLCGFDEGPVHPDWANELEKRGIKVTQGLLRDKAREVLKLYSDKNAVVYNGRRGK